MSVCEKYINCCCHKYEFLCLYRCLWFPNKYITELKVQGIQNCIVWLEIIFEFKMIYWHILRVCVCVCGERTCIYCLRDFQIENWLARGKKLNKFLIYEDVEEERNILEVCSMNRSPSSEEFIGTPNQRQTLLPCFIHNLLHLSLAR